MSSPARQDLHSARPWLAQPMERDAPGGAWEVVCPKRYTPGGDQLVASHLSEDDAKLIASAPEGYVALVEVVEKAPHDPGCGDGPATSCTCYRAMARRALSKRTRGGP
jgi:hypothetical protein